MFKVSEETRRINMGCHANGDGWTVRDILFMLSPNSSEVRLDDVIVTPVLVDGKLVLQIEVDPRLRQDTEQDALYVSIK